MRRMLIAVAEALTGESAHVSIPLPRESFERFDPATNTMRVVPGKYRLLYGNISADDSLRSIVVDVR